MHSCMNSAWCAQCALHTFLIYSFCWWFDVSLEQSICKLFEFQLNVFFIAVIFLSSSQMHYSVKFLYARHGCLNSIKEFFCSLPIPDCLGLYVIRGIFFLSVFVFFSLFTNVTVSVSFHDNSRWLDRFISTFHPYSIHISAQRIISHLILTANVLYTCLNNCRVFTGICLNSVWTFMNGLSATIIMDVYAIL